MSTATGNNSLMNRPKRRKRNGFVSKVPSDTLYAPAYQVTYVENIDRKQKYPTVFISEKANGKMKALIEAAMPLEVTWIPVVELADNGDVRIDDIFVPGQICSNSTTNITPDGESDLYSELIASGQTMKIKQLLGWGHSHVKFAVFSSGTDEDTTSEYVRDFTNSGKPVFVRLIANFWGEMFASIYFLKIRQVVHFAHVVSEPTKHIDYLGWANEEISKKVKDVPVYQYPAYNYPAYQNGGYYESGFRGYYDGTQSVNIGNVVKAPLKIIRDDIE